MSSFSRQIVTSLYQGEATPVYVTITDESGELLDLSGAEVRLAAYPVGGNESPRIDKDGVIVSEGYVRFDLSESDTSIAPGNYVIEVRVWLPTGVVRTVVDGPLIVQRSGFHAS